MICRGTVTYHVVTQTRCTRPEANSDRHRQSRTEVERMNNASEQNDILQDLYYGLFTDEVYILFVRWYIKSLQQCLNMP